MKRLVFCLLVVLGATAASCASGGCGPRKCGSIPLETGYCPPACYGPIYGGCCGSPGYPRGMLGPEETGNYAQPYLYSAATGKWYPDPMYYHAQGMLRRWHAIRNVPISGPPVKEYTDVKTGEN